MIDHREAVEAYFRSRIHNPRTLQRALRANADLTQGETVRGAVGHRFRRRHPFGLHAGVVVRKGRFIQLYGRRVWDMLHPAMIYRDGRRAGATFISGEELRHVPPGQEKRAAELLSQTYNARERRNPQRRITTEWLEAWHTMLRQAPT